MPWHDAPGPHLFFALTLFYGGGAYIALQCVLDALIGPGDGVEPWIKTVRIGCVVVGAALMGVYVGVFGVTGQGTTNMYQEGVESRGKTLMARPPGGAPGAAGASERAPSLLTAPPCARRFFSQPPASLRR